jgi:hypothetical protein
MTVGVLLAAMVQMPLSAAQPAAATPVLASSASACQRPAHRFVPVKAALPALGRSVGVIQVSRSHGAVGAGPVTQRGKWLMAMDPQTRPGSGRGTVILSGHAWPDGSALGNAMVRDLQVGNFVKLRGKKGQRACYQVAERASYRANKVPLRKVFRPRGPERVVIVTCSGRRLGPGHWTRRTVWYAVPYTSAPPRSPSSAPPASTGSGSGGSTGGSTGGGLFGGLLGGLFGGGG